jgi:N-formylglutamate amidohydrolase
VVPFKLVRPECDPTGIVFSSPHSGRTYDPDFLASTILDEHAIRSSEDAFIDVLVDGAPCRGVTVLTARAPRAFVDLNRGAEEMDPALVAGVRRIAHNPRVTSGLGVIPRVVANGRAIYRGKITQAEANRRIESYWRPFHDALQMVLNEQRARFGKVILLDWHSMPHEAIEGFSQGGSPTPDVVLGDRFGAAADGLLVAQIEDAFALEGLRVSRNSPFAGAYITQHYGRPAQGQHVVQVEIDRSLYMDEVTLQPRADFEAVKEMIDRITARIVDIGQRESSLAAE